MTGRTRPTVFVTNEVRIIDACPVVDRLWVGSAGYAVDYGNEQVGTCMQGPRTPVTRYAHYCAIRYENAARPSRTVRRPTYKVENWFLGALDLRPRGWATGVGTVKNFRTTRTDQSCVRFHAFEWTSVCRDSIYTLFTPRVNHIFTS